MFLPRFLGILKKARLTRQLRGAARLRSHPPGASALILTKRSYDTGRPPSGGPGSWTLGPVQSAITLAVITDNTRLFYVPARWLGEERLRRFLRRFGRFVLVY